MFSILFIPACTYPPNFTSVYVCTTCTYLDREYHAYDESGSPGNQAQQAALNSKVSRIQERTT